MIFIKTGQLIAKIIALEARRSRRLKSISERGPSNAYSFESSGDFVFIARARILITSLVPEIVGRRLNPSSTRRNVFFCKARRRGVNPTVSEFFVLLGSPCGLAEPKPEA
ncbi:hypothetical protein EVAR_24939_1 [Eumeta japonica]|uniref:Uncharacterized protein n=1 Tax=Eumeta variegata TaxID=151549 RepID=A0A4C1ZXL5_EUMVA|nr:hypothetical protein EVAR_24939_1 [Eumeta japonica]